MSRLLFYHYLKKVIVYFPSPLFFILSVVSIFTNSISICGAESYEMALMWFLMAVAHTKPWIEYIEVKRCPRGCGNDHCL
jgi:hypothetical protein